MLTRLFFRVPVFLISLVVFVISYPFAAIWRIKANKNKRDTSWAFGRELIFQKGIRYWAEILKDFRISTEGHSVLEVGSGNGQWLIALEELGASEIIGIEPNDEVRAYSLEKVKEYETERVSIKNGRAEELPVADDFADLVICLGVFMFTNQAKAMEEFKRALKPGGYLLLSVNGLGYFIMKAIDGVLFSDFRELRYGTTGILATFIKWNIGVQVGVSAVSVREMKGKFHSAGFQLERTWLHNDLDLYPQDHFGFPTNFAFRARLEN